MRFQSLTRRTEIGANSYLLEMDGVKMVLDSGLHPKEEGLDSLPRTDLLEPDSIDAIFVTHSHLDHLGSLPVLAREQPGAEIYLTHETRFLAEAMLHNSVNVMTHKREELGYSEYPFFHHREIDRLVKRWRTPQLQRRFEVDLDARVHAEFYPAGHILGAVGVLLESAEGTVFYTGDVKFEEQAIVKGAELPEDDIDTLVVETTRGAVSRDPNWSRKAQIDRLAEVINRTYQRGGAILLPVFALGRTQEFLVVLDDLKRAGAIPDLPISIGGLSTKITNLFDKMSSTARRNREGFRIMEEIDLQVASPKSGRVLRYAPGNIYVITSGMMTEKTLSHSFSPRMIENPNDAIIFTGYSDPDSPAGHLRAVGPGDRFQFATTGKKGPELEVRAEIVELEFSGHAEREHLLDYILRVNPKRAALVHGDPPARDWFKAQLVEKLPNCEVIIPDSGREFDW